MFSRDLSASTSPTASRRTTTEMQPGGHPVDNKDTAQPLQAAAGQTQLERLRQLLGTNEQPAAVASSDFRPSRRTAFEGAGTALHNSPPIVLSERGRSVADVKQRLLTAGVEVNGRVKALLSMGGYLGRNADNMVWEGYLAELCHEVDRVLADAHAPADSKHPEHPEALPEPTGAIFEVTPLTLPGKGGLALLRLRLPDGQALDAFSANPQDPGAYHERQLGSECTLSTINMLNAYLTGSFAGLRTPAQLQRWVNAQYGQSPSGNFDTRQACSFNNRGLDETGEGRMRLLVATLGMQASGEIVSVTDEDFKTLATDVFDRADAVGIVMRMPMPLQHPDAVRKESHHTVLLCREAEGRFQVRDSRRADCVTLEASNMSAAIGEYRRQWGMAGDSEENNILEVIYPDSSPGPT